MIRQGVGRDRGVWLTSHRLVQRRRSGWRGERTETFEIPLDRMRNMSIGFLRNTRLLIVGALLVLLGFATRNVFPGAAADIIWVIGIGTTIVYVVTGRRGLIVHGESDEIKVSLRGMSSDEVREFVFALEEARAELMGVELEDAEASDEDEERSD